MKGVRAVWYILQVTVWCTVVYYYVTEIAPDAHVGGIMLMASIITFLVTKTVSMMLDAAYRLIRPRYATPVEPSSLAVIRKQLFRGGSHQQPSKRLLVTRRTSIR